MIFNLYCVKDTVTGLFSSFFIFAVNKNEAIRTYLYLCNQNQFATDTALYLVGYFDNETGVIEPKCEFVTNYQSASDNMSVDSLQEVKDDE